MPHQSLFPYDTLEAQTARPERWTPTPNYPGPGSKPTKSPQPSHVSAHMTIPKIVNTSDPVKQIDVATALQYGQANGFPPLLSFIKQFTREVMHPNVPYEGGVDITLTVGATDGMSKTLEVFTNVWVEGKDDISEKPGILAEVFMYPSVQNQALPRGAQIIPVEMDEGGMAVYGPGSLDDVLSNWDHTKGRRPHLLYTVTYVPSLVPPRAPFRNVWFKSATQTADLLTGWDITPRAVFSRWSAVGSCTRSAASTM